MCSSGLGLGSLHQLGKASSFICFILDIAFPVPMTLAFPGHGFMVSRLGDRNQAE